MKLALVRALGAGGKVGVSWYLYPDESHNGDGRHISYLGKHEDWRHLDPALFDLLLETVLDTRSVRALQSAFAPGSRFVAEPVPTGLPASERSEARASWFGRSLAELSQCDLVFADPDNGLVGDEDWRRAVPKFGKQIPLSEARALSAGRCAVIYHHNSRFKGGHDAEVDSWLRALQMPALAVRATAYSCRTFFVINPDREIVARTRAFCDNWRNHKVRLHASTYL